MQLTPETKSEIDSKSYDELLAGWRFLPVGCDMMQGDTGKYWSTRMNELRALPGGDERHTAASKAIGWGL